MNTYILVRDDNGKRFAREWLDGDGWKNDLFYPLVQNGTLVDEDIPFTFTRKLWTGFLDDAGSEIFEGSKVSVVDFRLVLAEVKWVQKDGCWALFHEDFVRTVTEYKRLTQKNISKYKIVLL